VGIHGIRFTSPWKKVKPLSLMISALKAGATTPSLKSMLAVDSPEGFEALNGYEGGEDVAILKDFPNSILLHPSLFLAGVESGTVKAKDLAYKIIIEASGGYNQDPDDNNESGDGGDTVGDQAMEHAYQTLKYLWAIIQGYGRLTPVMDPDLSSEGEDMFQEKLEEAKSLLTNGSSEGPNARPTADKEIGAKSKGRRDTRTNPTGVRTWTAPGEERKPGAVEITQSVVRGAAPAVVRGQGPGPGPSANPATTETQDIGKETGEDTGDDKEVAVTIGLAVEIVKTGTLIVAVANKGSNRNGADDRTRSPREDTGTNEELDPRNPSDLQAMLINNQSMMMQQMTMFTRATLRQAEKLDKTKSMFSKMSEDDEILFDLPAQWKIGTTIIHRCPGS
jgi:hypothetical protein